MSGKRNRGTLRWLLIYALTLVSAVLIMYDVLSHGDGSRPLPQGVAAAGVLVIWAIAAAIVWDLTVRSTGSAESEKH